MSGTLWAATTRDNSGPADIRFETPFDRSNPLSHQLGGINSIIQDNLGFIWLAAENGLGRFDGRQLKIYQANPALSDSLPASYVRQALLDADGVIWLATEGGLARYQLETDNFVQLKKVGEREFGVESISALAVAKDNTLYVGSGRGLYVINSSRDRMSHHIPRPPILVEPNSEQIRGLAIDASGRVWLATAGMGVAIFDPQTKNFSYLLHDPFDSNTPAHNSLTSIMHDNLGRVWLGTYGAGISRIEVNGDFVHFAIDKNIPGALLSNVVWDIAQDSEGLIWVALDQGGLALFDEASQGFHHYLNQPFNPNSLVSNQLRVVYEDRHQDLWFGAFPSGINYYNRNTRVFRHYTANPVDASSLSHNAILKFKETRDGRIWVGTEGGLNAFDPMRGKFRRYLAEPTNPKSLGANAVLAIEEDIDQQLWIGTWAGGLHRFDPATEQFYRYQINSADPGSIRSMFIWDIVRDSDDNIWIATETSGLSRYDRASDSFIHYQHDPENDSSISGNFVTRIIEDRQGQLWIATYTGLDVMNRATGEFRHIPYETGENNSTTSKNIKALFEDSRGLIWVGTAHKGVNIYDPETETFTYLDVQQGLPSSTISSIIEDDQGTIWLATTNGLARVHYPTLNIVNFGWEDGLAGSNFNRDGSLKDHNGRLYFGSAEGITLFNPDDLNHAEADFPVRITRFRILNQEPTIAPDSPLSKSILVTRNLTLSYKHSMFSFDFSALNYRNSAVMRYAYKLEGFDREWHDIGKLSTATYTNISSGHYVFRARASVTGKDWVDAEPITIYIAPPWWRSWWAYGIYLGVLGMIIYYRHEFTELRIRAEVYRSKSITDPLTGLYNRLGIGQVAEGIFANQQTRKGKCVMLFDIDHFKRVNDRRGHDAGDRVLIDIAAVVRSCIRNSDYFGRWGGEEFILLAATEKRDHAQLLAEKIRAAVENQVYEKTLKPLRITVSVGVAEIRPEDSFESVIKRADTALYQAKASGRNVVVVAE